MRLLLAFGVLVCGAAVAAPVPKAKATDEDAIRGVWEVTTIEVNGMTVPAGANPMRFTFLKDGKLKLTLVGTTKEQGVTFKLDSAVKPKAIDTDEGKGRTGLGIYELDGDHLKICLAEGKAPVRPTELKAVGKAVMLYTLKRVADEKTDK